MKQGFWDNTYLIKCQALTSEGSCNIYSNKTTWVITIFYLFLLYLITAIHAFLHLICLKFFEYSSLTLFHEIYYEINENEILTFIRWISLRLLECRISRRVSFEYFPEWVSESYHVIMSEHHGSSKIASLSQIMGRNK